MPTATDALVSDPISLPGLVDSSQETPARSGYRPQTDPASGDPDRSIRRLLAAVLTTSLGIHLLVVGTIGRGLPADTPRPRVRPAEPAPVHVVENVRLEAPPPPPPPKAVQTVLPDELPAPSSLPDLAPIAAIQAVPATVKVDFAVLATGPVQLVRSVGEASGGRGAAIPEEPVLLDGSGTRGSLLSPPLSYPPDARLHRQSGIVVVEFRVNATGDIVDARVQAGSGHGSLDREALKNIRASRFTGRAGIFRYSYEFKLR